MNPPKEYSYHNNFIKENQLNPQFPNNLPGQSQIKENESKQIKRTTTTSSQMTELISCIKMESFESILLIFKKKLQSFYWGLGPKNKEKLNSKGV